MTEKTGLCFVRVLPRPTLFGVLICAVCWYLDWSLFIYLKVPDFPGPSQSARISSDVQWDNLYQALGWGWPASLPPHQWTSSEWEQRGSLSCKKRDENKEARRQCEVLLRVSPAGEAPQWHQSQPCQGQKCQLFCPIRNQMGLSQESQGTRNECLGWDIFLLNESVNIFLSGLTELAWRVHFDCELLYFTSELWRLPTGSCRTSSQW